MSQTDTESLKLKRIGTCSVCMRILSLTSSGTIHSHGHGSPCAGSGCPPVSLVDSTLQVTAIHTLKSTTVDVIQFDSNNQLDSQALLDSVIKAKCRVLKYIPKASRLQAAAKLTEVLDHILADPDNVNSWQQFLLFTYSCFGVGERGGKRHNRSLATRVNHALSDFTSTSSCRSQPTVTFKKKSRLKLNDDFDLAARVSAKIEEGDVRGAVRLAVSDDSLAPYSDSTVKALHELHPPRSAPMINLQLLPEPDVAPAQVLFLCHSDITEAIKSFPAGSAGGLDGLRPQHLKDMTSPYTGIIGQKLVSILVQFSNLCLAGRVPVKVRPVLYGASLCALAKKSGGVRPIAVGSTVRRLVAKAACRSVKDDVVIKLAPKQLGFGVRFGAEAAAHAARSFLSNLERGQALLKIDFSNAFNTLRRDQMLYMVRNELPELYPFIYSCYSDQSFLRFGQYTLTSEEGTQQGDPLGPLLYCCTTMSFVKRVKSVFNVWYMDDGTLGGNADALLTDFEMIVKEAKNFGLTVSTSKCELITDDDDIVRQFRAVVPDINHVNTSDAMLLGAPIGSEQSVVEVLTVKLHELRRLSIRISQFNAHDALFLLKNCFSIPKLTYTLRSAPCYTQQLLSKYDDIIRSTLQSILNISIPDMTWDQATLPVSKGGLGIRKATQIALPAFLSSVTASQSLVAQLLPHRLRDMAGTSDPVFTAAVMEWQTRTGSASVQPPFATEQKNWDEPLVSVQEMMVLSAAPDQVSKARLIAASAPHSGAFLHARPCSSLGTRLDNSSLRIAVALRLGAPICAPHVCICGDMVDSTGTHGLSCRKSAGRLSRHSAVNDLIKRALSSAEVPSRLEPSSLMRDDGKRPDGLSLSPWRNGRCLVWDFTCPDTLAPSHWNAAVTGPGVVAGEAEVRKKTKYSQLSVMYCFVPIAVETLGALGDDASDFLHQLGRRIANVTGERRATEFLLQRLSVAIQRGNAASVLGTVDSATDMNLDDVFYL
jgi:hypothetical protein